MAGGPSEPFPLAGRKRGLCCNRSRFKAGSRNRPKIGRVAAYLAWRDGILEFTGKWTAIREDFDLPPLEDEGERTGKWIADTWNLLRRASLIVQEQEPRIFSEVKELFPHGVDSRSVAGSKASALAVAEAIKLNLSKTRLAASRVTRTSNQPRGCLLRGYRRTDEDVR